MFRNNTTKLLVALLVIGLLAIYGFIQSKELLKGPAITIETPRNGETVSDPFIHVTGQASRINKLYLNDNQIFTDDAGRFEESLLLSRGYNILELRATDSFDREIIKILELVL